jgi:hypothetical protein
MERNYLTHSDKPTDIIAKGAGGFWKHLTYAEVLSPKMVDNLIELLLRQHPERIAVIEVRHNGKLAEYLRINLEDKYGKEDFN